MADSPPTVASPTSTDQPEVVVRKTDTATGTPFGSDSTATYLAATEKSILYKYRSWNYNFALGALPPEVSSNDAAGLQKALKDYHVFDSAGKGTSAIGISPTVGLSTSTNQSDVSALISSFDKNSGGRFDMYIDDVVIDSLIGAGAPQTGSSIATNVTFTLYEPYSMNGFVEALQVAAQAAGYVDYVKASFALRVQFQGYPDDQTLDNTTPEIVPKSTRYFCIQITGIEVDVTENGTRYRVSAVPINQMGFGTTNILTSDIKVSGNYVWEVLQNLFIGINQVVQDNASLEKGDNLCDKYEISCPALATPGNPQDVKKALLYSPNVSTSTNGTSSQSQGLNPYQNAIIKAKMNDELKDINVFKHADPSEFFKGYVGSVPTGSQPTTQGSTSTSAVSSGDASTGKLVPTHGTVIFAAGTQIHDCIAAVIRDSEYVRTTVLKNQVVSAKQSNGLITYFTIRMEIDIGKYDSTNNKYFRTYRYVVEPYQMMYNRVPGQAQGEVDHSYIAGKLKRGYDYIYTGKNLDIIKFQLQFNNLYYEAIPSGLGNRPTGSPTVQAAGPNNTLVAKQPQTSAAKVTSTNPSGTNPIAPIQSDPKQNNYKSAATGGQTQNDPYYKLAQTMNDSILNNVDLIQGSLEILGDPYFLVTGGMANLNLDLSSPYETNDGQAPTTQGDLFIGINFRNPIDIGTDGFVQFDQKLLPFSGIYRITTLKSSFKGGLFTQELDIIRSPGQVIADTNSAILPADIKTSQSTAIGSQVTVDTAPATALKAGIRSNDLNLANLVNRGLPNIGLPGVPSNFTNIAGSAAGILTQISGVTGQGNLLTTQLGVSPLLGLNPLTNGINLSPSALGSLSSVPNLSAAAIASAGSSIGSLANIKNAPISLAGTVSKDLSSQLTTLANGQFDQTGSITSDAASLQVINSLEQSVTQLNGTNISGAVGGINSSIASLQNTIPTDPTGISSKLGIDPSVLSGLSSNLSSKITSDLSSISEQVPVNVNLGSLENQGVFFSKMTNADLPKLPAVQPSVSTPGTFIDPALFSTFGANGDVSSLLDGATNLPALTDINNVSNSLGSVTAGLSGGLGSAQLVLDQVQASQGQVNSIVASSLGVTNPIGSLDQNSVGGTMPASVGLGSIESNISANSSIVQAVSNFNISGAVSTVAAKFGSLQTQSPLAKLIQKSNIQGSV